MIISKSDYIKYYQCPKCLWLYKNRKDLIPEDIGEQMAGMLAGGQAVEDEAYKLFPKGAAVPGGGFRESIDNTTKLILDKAPVIFQASFWNNDLFCRSDIIKHNPKDNTWDIYEVKSATKVKPEYIPDLAFQKTCLYEAGLKVNKTYIIYVNNEYVRQGEIEPEKFLKTKDVTKKVNDLIEEIQGNIYKIYDLIKQKEEPKVRIVKQCENPYPCMFIDYCWLHIPEHSIYNFYPSEDEINRLLDDNIIDLADVPAGIITRDKYKKYYEAHKADKVIINKKAIREELNKYKYPLYFLDYETNSPGVPAFNGYRPYQRMTFQYSLHVLEKPGGELKHYEYLADKNEDPSPGLAKSLSKLIGPKGSVVVWYKGFEAGCNTEMGERYPEYAAFFEDINSRLLDLMEFFSNGYYVDKNFFGSASLKKVLPVFVPHLSYQDLIIQEGMAASDSWPVLIGNDIGEQEKKDLKSDMLKYCGLDTYGMVEIFRILNEKMIDER